MSYKNAANLTGFPRICESDHTPADIASRHPCSCSTAPSVSKRSRCALCASCLGDPAHARLRPSYLTGAMKW